MFGDSNLGNLDSADGNNIAPNLRAIEIKCHFEREITKDIETRIEEAIADGYYTDKIIR